MRRCTGYKSDALTPYSKPYTPVIRSTPGEALKMNLTVKLTRIAFFVITLISTVLTSGATDQW
jgi:hypothetical protein